MSIESTTLGATYWETGGAIRAAGLSWGGAGDTGYIGNPAGSSGGFMFSIVTKIEL